MVLSNTPRLLPSHPTIMRPTRQGKQTLTDQQSFAEHPVGQWICRSEEVYLLPLFANVGEVFKQPNNISYQIVFTSPHLTRFDDTKTLYYTWRTMHAYFEASRHSSKRLVRNPVWPDLSIRLFRQCARSNKNYCIRRMAYCQVNGEHV
jgi:hypothetical protein